MTPTDFDPSSDDVWQCPSTFFEAVRRSTPAYLLPDSGAYLITRYDDVVAAAKRPHLFSNHRPPLGGGDDEITEYIAAKGFPEVSTLSTTDPPEHARYRSLVNRSFTPKAVAQIQPDIRAIVDALIDDFIEDREVEFVTQFANLVPAYAIADALGVDREHHANFKRWADDLIHLVYTPMSRERRLECVRSYVEFQHYFAERIEERRVRPGSDMVSHLVSAQVDDERPLDVPEILDLVRQFLVAGNETTASLIEGAMLLLIDHRDVLDEVQREPSLIAPMLEEAVRLVSPSQWQPRTIPEAAGVDGVDIPGCSRARLAWASANRDPTYFADPDRFDVHRTGPVHVAYGHGIHFCLGAWLARAEARQSFEAVLDRLRDIELTVPRSAVRYVPHAKIRRLNHLPLRFSVA